MKLYRETRRRCQKAYMAARRQLIINIKNVPCKDCNQKFPYYVMDFDHVRGRKKFNISQTLSVRPETLMREIKKCEVVCANCHRIRTYKRMI